MAMYHISSDGTPRVCSAAKGNCPLGAAGAEHGEFDSVEDARFWAEEENALTHGGSFGSLALQLAEKKVAEQELDAEQLAEIERRGQDKYMEGVASQADDLFSTSHLEYVASLKGRRQRAELKKYARIGEDFGLGPNASATNVFLTYLKYAGLTATGENARSYFRDRLVAGKMLRSANERAGGSTHAMTYALEEMEKTLNAVPNEDKYELNLSGAPAPTVEEMKQMSDEYLMQELKAADERERYFDSWAKSSTRLVNYGASQGRENQRKQIFGKEYDRIVTRGPSNGFTKEEARYYEDKLPGHWTEYHEALKAEAEDRLGTAGSTEK